MIVDGFRVKYLVKENALHLKSGLEDKYKVTTEWEVKLHIGIALKWGYEKVTVQISMPGYVRTALHSFQRKKTKRPQDSPYSWTQPIYEKNNQMIPEKAPAKKMDDNNQKILQKIVGNFIYYTRAVDPTIIMALNSLAEVQNTLTIETAKQVTQFLTYSAKYADAVTEYRRRIMVICIYLDASYI